MRLRLFVVVLTLGTLLTASFASAQSDFPPAEIVNDEGGPVTLAGTLELTNPNIISNSALPLVLLEDQTGFVNRDINYNFPLESQVMGAFTSDFYAGSPAYTLNLPIEPQGGLNDVDNDGEDDRGVQVFAIAYWDNRYGDPFVQARDGYGWSTAYASTRTSPDPATLYEIIGGRLLVWSPDDAQGFPSGFGDDGLLFTQDDPVVGLPAGYTLVDLDTDPFTFDRSRQAVVDLVEPASLQLPDFSAMSYTEAFDAFIDLAQNEYAFTEYKNVDWEALRAEFRPLVEQAEADNDLDSFVLALDALMQAVPDGHWQFPSLPSPVLDFRFAEQTSGGYGLALAELDDGRVIVSFVTADSPAEAAGIQIGAEITAWNGEPISEAIGQVVPLANASTPDFIRLQQARYLTRAPLGTDAEVTYRNPGEDEATVTLTSIEENTSFGFTSVYRGYDSLQAPLTFQFLAEGYGYVRINSFDNEPLMIENFEYFMTLVNQLGVNGIIFDMRQNPGGFSFIGARIAGHFFNEERIADYTENYNEATGEFFRDENFPTRLYPALDPALSFDGPVAVLVGPACASACEFFSYYMGLDDRAAIVGQYGTQGLGGGWSEVYLPDGLSVALPSSRPVDVKGNIIIESTGVQPTIDVPVTEESVLTGADVVLQAAIDYLNEQQ